MTTSGPGGAPVCYRHPDRESYILCQRCSRPICPQCQVSAAVGFQCPECVSVGTKGARPARTPYGGRLPGGDGTAVTITLTGLSLVCYLGTWIPDAAGALGFLAFSPFLAPVQPWRFLTHALIPVGFLPIITIYALFLIGRDLEGLLGRARLLVSWLLCAFGAATVTLLASAAGLSGFSGAIGGASATTLGLAVIWAILHTKRGQRLGGMALLLGALIVLAAVAGGWPMAVGAALAGGVCGAVLGYAPRNDRRRVQWTGLAALAGILVVLAVVGVLLG